MREKIKIMIVGMVETGTVDTNDLIDQILTLIKEEIKKSLLTDEEVWDAYRADSTDGDIRAIAEAQLDKVLKILT